MPLSVRQRRRPPLIWPQPSEVEARHCLREHLQTLPLLGLLRRMLLTAAARARSAAQEPQETASEQAHPLPLQPEQQPPWGPWQELQPPVRLLFPGHTAAWMQQGPQLDVQFYPTQAEQPPAEVL